MSRRTQIIERESAPSRSTPTDTGVAYVATLVEKGSLDPQVPLRSYDDFTRLHGAPQSWGVGAVWAEVFFREGGNLMYLSPVRGPAAAKAFANLAGSSGTTLVVTAKSEGEWGNGAAAGLTVEVVNGPAGASTRVLVIRLNGVEVERTAEATTQAGIVTNSAGLTYVTVAVGGGTASLPTVAAAANLAGGTLDRTNITDTQVGAALDLFVNDLGAGNLAAPDWPTATVASLLGAKAAAATPKRFAVPDTVSGSSKATLLTLGGTTKGNTNGSRMAGPYAPWLTLTAARTCPMSALFCARAAVTDATDGANQVPAGEYGRSTSSIVTGLTATFSDADAAALEAAGINLAILRNFEVRLDGNRTCVDPLGPDNEWLQIGNARFRMEVAADLEAAAQPWEHRQITPNNIAALDAALSGVMLSKQASFYPGDDDPGFIVDTGPAVNTAATAALHKFVAAVAYRPAPGADLVQIYVTKVGVADNLG
jgi:hypothetical protein